MNATYLITGANRGIGLAITAILLCRPSTTVIATVRSESTSTNALLSLPKGDGSQLVIGLLSADQQNTPEALLEILTERHHISQVDTLIVNAGTSSFAPLLKTPVSAILETFQTNTLLPIQLFQAIYPLFAKSKTPKVIYISSFLGSIAGMDPSPSLAYGMSKAAANYFVRKVHFECPEVVSLALHPGWLKTENGQNFADAVGAPEAPMEVDKTATLLVQQIDGATRDTTSGSFVRWDGQTVPW